MPRVRLDPDGTGNSQLGGIDTPLLSNDAANMDYVDLAVAAAVVAGGITSGNNLPTMNTVAGQAFILLANEGSNTPGYYYRNSANTAWIKDDTDGGGVNRWQPNTNYTLGDVIYTDGSGTFPLTNRNKVYRVARTYRSASLFNVADTDSTIVLEVIGERNTQYVASVLQDPTTATNARLRLSPTDGGVDQDFILHPAERIVGQGSDLSIIADPVTNQIAFQLANEAWLTRVDPSDSSRFQLVQTVGGIDREVIDFIPGDGVVIEEEAVGDGFTFRTSGRVIPEWAESTDYAVNDQVIRDGGSNVNSIYICYVAHNSGTAESSRPENNQDQWHLVRSGLVSVRGPDDVDSEGRLMPAGITGNSTLAILEGNGINVARDGTAFTVSQRASGHSDADDFGEGFAYSYYANFGFEERAQHEGIVGSRDVTAVITEVHRDDRGIRLVTETDISSATPSGGSNPYGFAVTDTPDRGDRTSLAPGATEDLIVYCTLDVPRNIYVSQIDPAVRTQADLETLFGISDSTTSRTGLSIGVNGFYTLMAHGHINPQYEPATWARENNTDPIPDDANNKLNNVEQWARTRFPDMDVPRTKLPADLVDAGTWDITRQAGDEQIIVSDTGDITVNLNPQQMGGGASGRIDFTNTSGLNWDATGFITNPATPTNITPIRDTEFVNNLLRFTLADESNLDSTIDFQGSTSAGNNILVTYNWDQPSLSSLSDTVEVTEDPVLTNRHYNLLNTTNSSDAALFDITPSNRSRGGRWTVGYSNGNRPLAPTATLSPTGGTYPATSFTASSDDGTVTSTAVDLGMGVSWRTASVTNNNRFFGNTTMPFISPYTNYTWTVRANNLTNTNGCVIRFDDSTRTSSTSFPNGTTTVNGSSVSTQTDLAIGGNVGNVVFTSTVNIYNRGSLSDDVIDVDFVRADTVDGTARSIAMTYTRGGFPPFSYPLFTLQRDDGTTIPTVAEWVAGAQTNASTSRTRTIGNGVNGIRLNNTGTTTRYLWVAYPTGVTAFTRVTFDTTVGATTTEDTEVTLADFQRSSADVTLVGSGAPQSSSEDYGWFWVEVPAGNDITLRSVR